MGARATNDCKQVDEHLDGLFGDPTGELPEEVRGHIDVCPRCTSLYRWMTGGRAGETVGPELLAKLEEQAHADLRPVKTLPSNRVLVLRFLGIFVVLKLAFLGWLGADGLRMMTALQLGVVSMVLLTGAVLLAVSLSWQMVPGERQRIPVPVLVSTFLAGFLIVAAAMFPWNSTRLFESGWSCSWAGLLVAVPGVIVLLYLASRGAPLSYPKLGASVGAAAGLLGLAVLQYHCPQQEASHLMLWHGVVVVISVGAGYVVGQAAQHVVRRARR